MNQFEYLKKARTWNTVMRVTSVIALIAGAYSLLTTFFLSEKDYKVYGDAANLMFQYEQGWLFRSFSIFNLVALVSLIIYYFAADKQLRQGKFFPEYPYYVGMGMMALNFLFGKLTAPQLTTDNNVFASAGIVGNVIGLLIIMIPPILIILNMRQAMTAKA